MPAGQRKKFSDAAVEALLRGARVALHFALV
jgi:hypothetical protein